MIKRMLFAIMLMLVLFVLAAPLLTPQPVQAGCGDPKTDYEGALNMVHDAKMDWVMSTHVAPNGNTGMFTAVANSGCGHP